jgi:hypothetical protein
MKAMADVAQKNVGTAPNMPETMPIVLYVEFEHTSRAQNLLDA